MCPDDAPFRMQLLLLYDCNLYSPFITYTIYRSDIARLEKLLVVTELLVFLFIFWVLQ